MLDYGREICCDGLAARREWLVTNGIGGFASGTLAGVNTRRYHGLLIAALQPPLGRTLLVSGLRDQVDYDGAVYPLAAQAARPGAFTPGGVDSLMRFHLEDTTPVWTYAFEDALLEKRVWMQTGANTTYIRYQLLAGSAPAALQVDVQINWRDMHGNTRAEQVAYTQAATTHGLKIGREGERASLYILSSQGEIAPAARRPEAVFLAAEHERGLNPLDHVSTGASLRHTLKPGESLTLVLTTEVEAALDGDAAYVEQHQREDLLVLRSPLKHAPDWIGHLVLAADQFIVRRAVEGNGDGRSVIAGYHWFGDWGRDTMIALPGLTLATGRFADAATILRTFARFVSHGMLPNRFPDSGDTPEYNTVDATLWYFEAIRAYHAATGDDELVRELYPTLREIIAWHVKGTRYNIGVDPVDGLLHAGEPGVQLTWMDVKIGGWVVTPRHGKPVEINALWYNALRCMVAFAQQLQPLVRDPAPLQDDAARFERMAEAVRASFGRFWNAARGCLYDVIDTPEGNDAAIRPNQLFAVSLHHNVLDGERAQAVVAVCARKLLTSVGLRSLAPDDPHYIGVHTGNPESRDSAYHQGTVWTWLIGPFVSAHYRVHGDKAAALRYLEPFRHHLDDGCVGTLGECAHGDPPHRPTAAVAQAWSVAEALRVYSLLERT
ncbi:MAG: glycogen debranching enzyme N-terminal domain-containing protein [Anaerolineae bacterium]|nr:glycogen debranching enzyme N-terminal domain-containing protein [Anaerolineae bacterium]